MYKTLRTGTVSEKAAVLIALWEGQTVAPEGYADLDATTGGAIARCLARPEFSAAAGSLTTVHPDAGAERVYIAGLGKRERFRGDVLRQAGAAVVKAAHAARLGELKLHVQPALNEVMPPVTIGRVLGEGLSLGAYAFEDFKGAARKKDSSTSSPDQAPSELVFDPADDGLKAGVDHALTVGESVAFARRLAATPPNVCNPAWLSEQCQAMADEMGLTCRVIDDTGIRELGMGGLAAVGSGGSTPPALIVLEHKPDAARNDAPLLLVGKSITFDTGGYSLKPTASMTGMKYDMCGGTAVIGAIRAIAALKLPVHVVAVAPVAENMIDATAFRVDDILTFCNGVTCEVTNTDAEGRLVLADALAWSTRVYQPEAVVDLATLTGGVVVALGGFCAGCFVNDDALRQSLFDAGDDTGERLWRLPLWEEHRELMKGQHADLVNSGGRTAHPIQGAAFLSHFIGEEAPTALPTLPWAHLDIAGVADAESDTPLHAKGPTGFGVRLLTRLTETWRAADAE